MDETAILNAAAAALTDDDEARYVALRNANPHLNWHGHDRRYTLMQLRREYPNAEPGALVAKLAPDPQLEVYLVYVPWTIALADDAIQRCIGCGAAIYWSQRHWKPHPFDVEAGRGTTRSHFDSCPKADDFRSTPKKQTRSRKKAA